MTLMTQYRIDLQPVLDGNFKGELISIHTDDPQRDLEEWLATNHAPLDTFKFSTGPSSSSRGCKLTSRTYPAFTILVTTFRIVPVHPRNLINFNPRRRKSR